MMDRLRYTWRSLSLPGRGAAVLFACFLLLAALAPLVSPFSPDKSSGPAFAPPGGHHLLGTDQLGFDLWSMICHGSRTSMAVGLATAVLAGIGGAWVGMIAGLRGGWVDGLVSRAIDTLAIIPDLPAIIVLAAFLGPSLTNIILVLAFVSWARPARIARAQTLVNKELPYARMSRYYGAGTGYLVVHHLLPELMPIVVVNMIMLTGRAIVAEASMSFLGLGDPASKSWGLIINHALSFPGIFFTPFWRWWLLYPWLFLTLLVTSLAVLGRELERIADPRIGLKEGTGAVG